MSVEFAGYVLAFFIFLFALFIHYAVEFKHKIILKVYTVKKERDGKKIFSAEREIIGAFQSQYHDKERDRFVIKFRHGIKSFIVYSPENIQNIITHWFSDRFVYIIYSCNAYVYEKELKASEIRTQTLKYDRNWQAYFVFKTLYYLNFRGIAASMFITGLLIAACFGWESLAFFIGMGIGLGIAALNTYLYRTGIIKPQQKIETVSTEKHLHPIGSNTRYDYIFDVKLIENTTQKMADGVEQIVPVEKDIKIDNYDDLYRIINDKNKKVLDYKAVDIIRKRRTYVDQITDQRNYLAKNWVLYETIDAKSKIIEQLNNDNIHLTQQISHLNEDQGRRIREFGERMLLEQDRVENTVEKLLAKFYTTNLMGLTYQQAVTEAIKTIKEQESFEILAELKTMANIQLKILEKLSQNSNIDTKDLINLFKLEKKDFLEDMNGTQAERTKGKEAL